MCLRGDTVVALHGFYLINGGGNTIVIAEGHGLGLHNECDIFPTNEIHFFIRSKIGARLSLAQGSHPPFRPISRWKTASSRGG